MSRNSNSIGIEPIRLRLPSTTTEISTANRITLCRQFGNYFGHATETAESTFGGLLSCSCNFKQSRRPWKYHRGRCIARQALRPVERRRNVVADGAEADGRVGVDRRRDRAGVELRESRGTRSRASAGKTVDVVAEGGIRGCVGRCGPAQ